MWSLMDGDVCATFLLLHMVFHVYANKTVARAIVFFRLSIALCWKWYLRHAMREFQQILLKQSLGLLDLTKHIF